MKASTNLVDYIKARHSNEWGWVSNLESKWVGNIRDGDAEKWARLCGIYNDLLDEALDMIPPCILNELD